MREHSTYLKRDRENKGTQYIYSERDRENDHKPVARHSYEKYQGKKDKLWSEKCRINV